MTVFCNQKGRQVWQTLRATKLLLWESAVPSQKVGKKASDESSHVGYSYMSTKLQGEIYPIAFQTWQNVFCSVVLSVRFRRSTMLLQYAVVFNFVTPKSSHTSFMTCKSRFVPLSDNRASGTPNIGTTSWWYEIIPICRHTPSDKSNGSWASIFK